MHGFESASSWRQPQPAPASAVRTDLVDALAVRIHRLGGHRLRVAIDGLTAAGKTSFGHELAAALRELGRPTLRACLDDFKHPWRHAREFGYDRLSGEGYYRNAYDFAAIRNLLLCPAGPDGSGQVVLCAHDPLTGEDHRLRPVGLSHLARRRPRARPGTRHRPRHRPGRPRRGDPRPPGSLLRRGADLHRRGRPAIDRRRVHRQPGVRQSSRAGLAAGLHQALTQRHGRALELQ